MDHLLDHSTHSSVHLLSTTPSLLPLTLLSLLSKAHYLRACLHIADHIPLWAGSGPTTNGQQHPLRHILYPRTAMHHHHHPVQCTNPIPPLHPSHRSRMTHPPHPPAPCNHQTTLSATTPLHPHPHLHHHLPPNPPSSQNTTP